MMCIDTPILVGSLTAVYYSPLWCVENSNYRGGWEDE